jgi:hypothetical protein
MLFEYPELNALVEVLLKMLIKHASYFWNILHITGNSSALCLQSVVGRKLEDP